MLIRHAGDDLGARNRRRGRIVAADTVAGMVEPIGRLDVTAIDCPDARQLADFYWSILGGRILEVADGHWVELHSDGGRLAFQRIDDHRPPTWPDGDVPQQAHVDVDVEDLDVGEEQVLRLGAVKADVQPSPNEFRVFLDPVGHPFCLVKPGSVEFQEREPRADRGET